MNVRKHREPMGEVKTCSLLIKNQKYYVVFSCEVEAQPKIEIGSISKERQTGIDMGMSQDNFFALSNGEKQVNPQFYQTAEKELGILQRKISRKEKRSKRREKTKLELSKEHEKVSNQRKDFDFFGVEKLRTRKIMERSQEQNPWYSAKSLHDASLSFFLLALSHRVEETGGRLVKVNPAYTSQRCSNCQQLASRKLALSDRIFVCAWCKKELDRDVNAAKNILYQAQITELGTNFDSQVKSDNSF